MDRTAKEILETAKTKNKTIILGCLLMPVEKLSRFLRNWKLTFTNQKHSSKIHVAIDVGASQQATMGDGVSDDGNGGEPLILASPAGRTDATSFEDTMDKEVEVIEQEQKLLARIICTPHVKTFIPDILKQRFVILKDIDTNASITSTSGVITKLTMDFPKGKKFVDAFKPVQSIDTKGVRWFLNYQLQHRVESIKCRHTRLLDFPWAKYMYLDAPFQDPTMRNSSDIFLASKLTNSI